MDPRTLEGFVAARWETEIVPTLLEYVRIPARSPHFDPAWQAHGALESAVRLAEGWCRKQSLPGLSIEVLRLPGRTPLLVFEWPGSAPGTVLLYGHLDKQPEMTGWREGLGPWTPVLEHGRLYGRGAADDGYAVFAAVTALLALHAEGTPHARCVGLVECSEESGSPDLPAYLEALAPRLGAVDLVVGLDSGCGSYDALWVTTSLRGIAAGTLDVEVLSEGVHSGDGGGIVPSSFRIARRLLERLEDAESGRILPPELHAAIPPERLAQAREAAQRLGDTVWRRFPLAGATRPAVADPVEAVLARTWRPALEVVGADGLPPAREAGNVLRPRTRLQLSLRLPPPVAADPATRRLRKLLEADPPHGANVRFEPAPGADGWSAPPTASWLREALDAASRAHFGRPAVFMGEGGSIPFMAFLGARFPAAQFLITGVLGPGANAHGPNEFLHLDTARRLTACVAQVLASHAARAGGRSADVG